MAPNARLPVERRIVLPSLSLAAQEWGAPDAPPLLAVHGWLDNAGSWSALAPLLAERRVIALELPGHGHSGHLPPGLHYHFVDYVRAVLEALEALDIARCDLLGHSLGAGVASLAAAAAPERFGHLFLIEGLGPLGDDGSRTLERFRDGVRPRTSAASPLRRFRNIDEAVEARHKVSGLPKAQARPIVERGVRSSGGSWQWRSDPRLTRSTPLRLAEGQVHDLLRGITAPTELLLARPATSYLPSEPMQRRIDCVADIRVSHMDGGHHLQLEHPQAVAAWLQGASGDERLALPPMPPPL